MVRWRSREPRHIKRRFLVKPDEAACDVGTPPEFSVAAAISPRLNGATNTENYVGYISGFRGLILLGDGRGGGGGGIGSRDHIVTAKATVAGDAVAIGAVGEDDVEEDHGNEYEDTYGEKELGDDGKNMAWFNIRCRKNRRRFVAELKRIENGHTFFWRV